MTGKVTALRTDAESLPKMFLTDYFVMTFMNNLKILDHKLVVDHIRTLCQNQHQTAYPRLHHTLSGLPGLQTPHTMFNVMFTVT